MVGLKLASLFDGSGGFPLAASMCGINPVWASEVEPYPIAVTTSRFPNMKHLGSVTEINGAEVEPVDIITFGSPCQDLSVAGLRKGLKHEGSGDIETTRSGLFMEAVRIIKEMREATNGVYPRFAVWENVPGAFSSNGGEDFRTVLEELIKIKDPEAVMPPVPRGGWSYFDLYRGFGWSLAYRVFDAQYWGVPQRRRRIYLVADFTGQCAGEILFKREGLRGYSAESGTQREGTAGDAKGGTGIPDRETEDARTSINSGIAATLSAQASGTEPTVCIKDQHLFENHGQDSRYKGPLDICPMLPAHLGTGGNNQPLVLESEPLPIHDQATRYTGKHGDKQDGKGNGLGVGISGDPMYTVTSGDRHAICYSGTYQKVTGPLMANTHPGCYSGQDAYQDMFVVGKKETAVVFDKEVYNSGKNAQGGHYVSVGGPVQTVRTGAPPGVAIRYVVRRLTPTECARLQGFPDHWGHPDQKNSFTDEEYAFWVQVRTTHQAINGKKPKTYGREAMLKWYNGLHTDSSEYKMWGNGIALPNALYVMEGISEVLRDGQT